VGVGTWVGSLGETPEQTDPGGTYLVNAGFILLIIKWSKDNCVILHSPNSKLYMFVIAFLISLNIYECSNCQKDFRLTIFQLTQACKESIFLHIHEFFYCSKCNIG